MHKGSLSIITSYEERETKFDKVKRIIDEIKNLELLTTSDRANQRIILKEKEAKFHLFTSTASSVIRADLQALHEKLNQIIPPKKLDRNLLIATWNIRRFGDVLLKWTNDVEEDIGKRDLHTIYSIAEIISRFDVIAVQEVAYNSLGLKLIMEILGPNWGFMFSGINKSRLSNRERSAFIFDLRRVQPSGLASNIILPEQSVEYKELNRQFARAPYAVGFKTVDKEFSLITHHTFFGSNRMVNERVLELEALAKIIFEWVRLPYTWNQNVIVLGDFNIDKINDRYYQAFRSQGLYIHKDFNNLQRISIKAPNRPPKQYDQIAWFKNNKEILDLSFKYKQCNIVPLREIVLLSQNLSDREFRSKVTDHNPIWVEFDIR